MYAVVDNVLAHNKQAINRLESDLWDVIAEIKANAYEVKHIPSMEAIERKYELNIKYERMAALYSGCDPFSKTKLDFNY